MDSKKFLSVLLEQIEENITERRHIKDLSKMNYISDVHLQRIFKSSFGITLGNYIRSRALSSSLDLLHNSNMRIIDIALEYGFVYEQTYIRAFKKQFGLTPGEYRNNPVVINKMPQLQLFNQSKLKNIFLFGSEAEGMKVLQYIDDWASFYLNVMGDAKHMESYDNGRYTIIRPKNGNEGATSIFNIRFDKLSNEEISETVREIKMMKKHTWWNLAYSVNKNEIILPSSKPQPTPEDWEVYALMLPDEKPTYPYSTANIQRITTLNDFKNWCSIMNQYVHGGYEIIHPNHYHLCENGTMCCYIAYVQGVPAAVTAMLKNEDICYLEFTATVPEYRQKGLATDICQKAIDEAFRYGAKMVTARTYDYGKNLGRTLGFKYI